ncbi:BQ5605_C032g11095 [Microbotryum silenes-dioicae]|uniref:BQ5605_C032g11095 protein n=1 Tax=Microbotryum silenes-dioicae TaxID=796604 RepID=A0A2X0MHH8_9BASI|nr:BQ5605_C032g11095 [Microbotryum silenes-dioicae]
MTPWACSSARCWAPRGSTLLFVPLRSTESAPRRVMTTIQPILALRHVYEPAVQLRVRRARIALKPLKPHVSIRDDLGPQTAVCTHCKAQHWELGATVFRVFGRLYHRLGALIPAVNQCPAFAQTWLINPAEATDTRLEPDGADSHMQRSTLTKLESMLRTGNRFMREFASAKARAARKWRCLSAIPTPTREIVDVKTLFSRCTVIDVPRVGPSTRSLARSIRLRCLRYPLLFPAGEDGFHPNIPLCGSTMVSNCARYLPVSVWMTKTNRRTKTATMRMKTARKGTKRMVMANDEGQVKGSRWRVSRSQFFAHYLPKATSTSQSRIAPNVPSWTIPGCDGVRCQTWKASAAHHDDVRPRLTGNQGCTGADKACNRPDLIARVFEAKSGNKRHAGCFGNECKMNGFCFFATVRLSCYFLNFILPLI